MCCLKFENEVYTHLKKGMPAVGERIKTPDGMAIVSDVNILENIIKTRLVLDNGKKDENGEEKLSTEFYNYGKEEIKRINKKHGHGGHKKKEKEDDLDVYKRQVHIRHLREKLEINPEQPRHLKVVWGQGYKIE